MKEQITSTRQIQYTLLKHRIDEIDFIYPAVKP